MLELSGVDGRYGQIQAVRGLTLTVAPGESLALLGRNGSGKSTALKLMAGVLRPAAGEIRWDGEPVHHLPPEERIRRGIVLVPEGRGIFPALSVDENLRMGAYWWRPRRRQLDARLDEVYGILPAIKVRRVIAAGSLSGGEQQMVALGRAFMSKPRLLLVDEPSLGLAPLVLESLYASLGELAQRGIGIVLVEQYVGLASRFCTTVAGLKKGRLAFHGPAASSSELLDIYMGEELAPAVLAGNGQRRGRASHRGGIT
jgi:branched-chain amino acid transport system ATP-binding protein